MNVTVSLTRQEIILWSAAALFLMASFTFGPARLEFFHFIDVIGSILAGAWAGARVARLGSGSGTKAKDDFRSQPPKITDEA